MRDHRKLKAFELADKLVILIYRATREFPREEQFGLSAQLRRAALSAASNIVEGCARHSEADYLRFLDMAYGSICEAQYQVSVAERLGYFKDGQVTGLKDAGTETSKALNGLIRSLRRASAEYEA